MEQKQPWTITTGSGYYNECPCQEGLPSEGKRFDGGLIVANSKIMIKWCPDCNNMMVNFLKPSQRKGLSYGITGWANVLPTPSKEVLIDKIQKAVSKEKPRKDVDFLPKNKADFRRKFKITAIQDVPRLDGFPGPNEGMEAMWYRKEDQLKIQAKILSDIEELNEEEYCEYCSRLRPDARLLGGPDLWFKYDTVIGPNHPFVKEIVFGWDHLERLGLLDNQEE